MEQKTYIYKKVIDIPIYFGKFVIVATNNMKKLDKATKLKTNKTNLYATTFWNMYDEDEGFFVAFNFWNKNKQINHGVIAHEAVHIADFIFESRGVQRDWENDEPYAYIVQFLVDEIYKFIYENNLQKTLEKYEK